MVDRAPLRIALLGCGSVARRFHLPALRRVKEVRVVAVADPDERARAAARALAPEAVALGDWGAVLEEPGIDAVVVCLPSDLHARAAIACLGRGKHLYLEKPIALTVEDAEQVVACAEGRGLTAQLGFNFRFHPMIRAARAAIGRGELGRVLAINGTVTNQTSLHTWRGRGGAGGGALIDLAVHHIDLARFLLGDELGEVSAAGPVGRDGRQTVQLTGRMVEGTLVGILASNEAGRLDHLEIVGENDVLGLDRMTGAARRIRRRRSRGSWRRERLGGALGLAIGAARAAFSAAGRGPEPSFALALEAFVATVRNGGAQRGPTLADGLAAARVVAAAERALARGRTVQLSRKNPVARAEAHG